MEGRDLAKSRRAKNFRNKAHAKETVRKRKKHGAFYYQPGVPQGRASIGGMQREIEQVRLARVYETTVQRCLVLGLDVPVSTLFDINKLPPLAHQNESSRKTDCIVEIVESDTMVFTKKYVKKLGLSPLVLNMASDFQPGGGVRSGKTAQEECIFRMSNAFMTHPEEWYPLKPHQVIYSPAVTVVKKLYSTSGQDYVDTKPWRVSMLAVPAVRKPRIRNAGYRNNADADLMEQKIDAIFKIALHHGHDSLVLGALGCGAFRNPPTAVAAIFKRCVDKYKPFFKRIGFAILITNTGNRSYQRDRDNLEAFVDAFFGGTTYHVKRYNH